jgi:ParB family chromosome partitioning protein
MTDLLAADPSAVQNQNFAIISIEAIHTNPFQPRRYFDPRELAELSQSIKEVGLIHPPLVRPLGNDKYELISGERRYQACCLAGLSSIPVVITQCGNLQSARMALIENIQRVDLNPIEVAKAIKQLIDEFNLSQAEVSEQLGKKRSTIANYLRLLSLPPLIQQSLLKGHITMGHAKAILSLDTEEKQTLLHGVILKDGISVRAAEMMALKIEHRERKQRIKEVNGDFFLDLIAEKIQQQLATKVNIQSRAEGKGGRIYIDYYSFDDLDRLIKLLGVTE